MPDPARYVPTFSTRVAEIRAVRELAGPTKGLFFPVVRLQPWPNAGRLERGLENFAAAFDGRPAALDLAAASTGTSERGEEARAELRRLRQSAGGFAAWQSFVAGTHFVPTVQWTDDPLLLRTQVEGLAQLNRGLVLRLKRSAGWNLAQLAHLAAVPLAGVPILVLLDYEQIGRGDDLTLAALQVQNTALAANSLLVGADATFVLLGSSFPSEFASIDRTNARLEIRERTLHALVASSPTLAQAGIVISYGDHASVFAGQRDPGFRGPPRVDYAGPRVWTYHRRTHEQGFQAAAEAIMEEPEWDDTLLCWGAQEIRRAASGDCTGLNSLGKWAAIRISTHLHQQAHFGGQAATPIDEPWTE